MIIRKLKSYRGAIDKILVTLLLVIIGVGGTIGLTTWVDNQKENIQIQAVADIDAVLEESAPAAGE